MFTILTVCTGNLCRSPIAAQLLGARLDSAEFEVASAGTGAVAGAPMPHEATLQSLRYGGRPAGHRSVRLSSAMVAAADLILTAEVAHRALVLDLHPGALNRTFTLRQFARLADRLSGSELAMLSAGETVKAVAAQRGYRAAALDDDIADPYLGSAEVYDRAGREIAAAVDGIVRAFSAADAA